MKRRAGGHISLTIDNGPTSGITPQVLDVLARHAVPATFFVLGEAVLRPGGREMLARAGAEGHRIGNHTHTHSVLFGLEDDQRRVLNEIDRAQEALGRFGAERLFRPFGGGELGPQMMSRTAYEHLRKGGYTMVLWNSIPGDYLDAEGWPEVALSQAAAQDWTVTVVHDLPNGAMDHLERFIMAARRQGATFRADFPDSVVPLAAGRPRWPMDAYMTER